MLFQISLGVDIGQDELCLVCLKASSRDIRLVAHAVYSIEKGIHDEEKSRVISGLIRRFLQENRITPASVFLGIPRTNVILRYVELPIAVKENLRETLGYELEKHVPFSPEDVYYDFQIISEDKSAGRLQLLLVVAKKQALSIALAVSEQLGFGISGLGITAIALADFFSWRSKKDNVIVKSFVFNHEDHIELGLVKDGILRYSRDLSVNEGLIEAFLAALSKIRLNFVEDNEPLDTILCGIEKDDPLVERLNNADGIALHQVDLSESQIPSTALMAAYGFALKGVRKTSMDINLLPPVLRKRPSKFKFYAFFGLLSLVLLGAMAWGGGVFFQRQWTQDRLDEEIKKLGSQLKKMEQVEAEKRSIEDQIDYLNTLRQAGPPVLEILKELSERIPKNAWVKRFDFSEKGIQLEGYSTSSSELIPLLEASPMFSGVKFLAAINKDFSGKERFRIGLSLK